ncbi:MAG: aldo/keto reductase, partial [Deltaproteobacteria bacterium]
RALDDLVRSGKVLYIGASNYTAYRLMESLWVSDRGGLERFVSLQAQYNLLDRDLEREHVPACEAFGLGILPWSPLAGGMLTGKYRRGRPMPADARLAKKEHWRRRYDHPKAWDTVEACVEVAETLGVAPAQVALSWLLGRPGVTSVVFGARTVEQLEANLGALTVELPPEAPAARRGVRPASRLPLRVHAPGAGTPLIAAHLAKLRPVGSCMGRWCRAGGRDRAM